MEQYNQQFLISNGFKQSNILKKWNKRSINLDRKTMILGFRNFSANQDKCIALAYYDVFFQGPTGSNLFSLRLTLKKEFKAKKLPQSFQFAWLSEHQAKQWYTAMTTPYEEQIIVKSISKRNSVVTEWTLPEFDSIGEQVNNYTLTCRPSFRSRNQFSFKAEQILSTTPHSIKELVSQVIRMIDRNLLIVPGKLIYEGDGAHILQCKQLTFRLMLYTMHEKRMIYEEMITPSSKRHWNPQIKDYQIYPIGQKVLGEVVQILLAQQECQRMTSFDEELDNQFEKKDAKVLLFTQKQFQYNNIYVLVRQFTGEEVNIFIQNYFISKNTVKQKRQKLISQVISIFDSDKEEFASIICEDLEFLSQEAADVFLLNFFRGEIEIEQYLTKIKKNNNIKQEEVIVQQQNDSETEIKVEFITQKKSLQKRLTSELNQKVPKEELQKLLEYIRSGQPTLMSIKENYCLEIQEGLNEFLETTIEDGHYIFAKNYQIDEKKGGLIYLNQKLVTDQRRVIMNIIKRVGSNIIQGKSVMSISLPIEIFESRSFLERMARSYGHAPIYLEKAVGIHNVIERFKIVTAFYMASFMMGIQQEKPFNPILGETFQGRSIFGCPIYLEQTNHHPPISNYIFYGRGYKIYGSHCPIVSMGINCLQGDQRGQSIIQFEDTGLKFYYIWQPFTVYNITIGQRNVNCQKRCFCFQPDLQLACEIIFNPKTNQLMSLFQNEEKIDSLGGNLMKVTKDCIDRMLQAHKTNSGLTSKLKVNMSEDVVEILAKVSGRWTCFLEFNGIRYWDINEQRPYILELEKNPLPSDCIFREDVLFMKLSDNQMGQQIKEEMEEKQRQDQKLREKMRKKKQKK